ncbi:hypothetical protein HMPREF9303_1040 [Prevotella denticola CRIS 18C-A]|uniref:Uncharacterized protein n=1 Tax=Prevotella denticola CRIS 18C-A TaxID=944557 RepID=F0H4H6_9BACT|nr:hypothetical protein HMPREF9303_1040 [Prevotella denticola CRIS 18C-A]
MTSLLTLAGGYLLFKQYMSKKSQENIKTYWIVLIFINFLSYNCHYSQ